MIVVDASAVLDGLLRPEEHDGIVRSLVAVIEPAAAPDLLDVEVISVLRRWERRREITSRRAAQALADLDELPVIRYPARALNARAWQLLHNLTAYDAQYVALAEELSAALLTTDAGMATAATRVRVRLHDP